MSEENQPPLQGSKAGINHHRSILDEFTTEPVSRQRKWQLRKIAEGACSQCGEIVPLEIVMTSKGFKEKKYKTCRKCRAANKERQKYYSQYGGDAT
jgi:16S rRNA U1498 N3-methylase RsmE